ncbi:hypothetical protein K438DRAFT_1774486 [Mycena galopus ATCC 62051]|nr:hypothetical protein K438DRAFT_1774486 [Mycena galopus ATCC 62051]
MIEIETVNRYARALERDRSRGTIDSELAAYCNNQLTIENPRWVEKRSGFRDICERRGTDAGSTLAASEVVGESNSALHFADNWRRPDKMVQPEQEAETIRTGEELIIRGWKVGEGLQSKSLVHHSYNSLPDRLRGLTAGKSSIGQLWRTVPCQEAALRESAELWLIKKAVEEPGYMDDRELAKRMSRRREKGIDESKRFSIKYTCVSSRQLESSCMLSIPRLRVGQMHKGSAKPDTATHLSKIRKSNTPQKIQHM